MTRTRLTAEPLERRDQPSVVNSALESRIDRQMDDATGRVGFALVSDGHISRPINGDQVFGTSSTIKLGVLYALMRRVDNPPWWDVSLRVLGLDRQLNVGAQYGDNPNNALSVNQPFKLKFLAEQMIHNSNNWATNRLIDYLGVDFINSCFANLGLRHTRIDRYNTGTDSPSMHGLSGPKADYMAGHDNETTPNEITRLLRLVHENNGLLSAARHTAFWEIMDAGARGYVDNHFDDFVTTTTARPSWAPAINLANKPGSNTWTGAVGAFTDDPTLGDHFQRSEAGRIVFGDGRVAFYGVFVDEARDKAAAESAIAGAGFEIARQFAPNTLTVTPPEAQLGDDREVVLRGGATSDTVRLWQSGTTHLVLTLNGTSLPVTAPTAARPMSVEVITGAGDDRLTVDPGLTLAHLRSLHLNAGAGNDIVTVTSSTTATILIEGGSSQETVGDQLIYRGPGQLNNSTPPHIARPGYRNVFFSGFERFLQPPTLSAIANTSAVAGKFGDPIRFTVTDVDSDLTTMRFTATARVIPSSLDPLRPVPGSPLDAAIFGGSGTNRTVSLKPKSNFVGVMEVTIRAFDETNRVGLTTFRVTVVRSGIRPSGPSNRDGGLVFQPVNEVNPSPAVSGPTPVRESSNRIEVIRRPDSMVLPPEVSEPTVAMNGINVSLTRNEADLFSQSPAFAFDSPLAP